MIFLYFEHNLSINKLLLFNITKQDSWKHTYKVNGNFILRNCYVLHIVILRGNTYKPDYKLDNSD